MVGRRDIARDGATDGVHGVRITEQPRFQRQHRFCEITLKVGVGSDVRMAFEPKVQCGLQTDDQG